MRFGELIWWTGCCAGWLCVGKMGSWLPAGLLACSLAGLLAGELATQLVSWFGVGPVADCRHDLPAEWRIFVRSRLVGTMHMTNRCVSCRAMINLLTNQLLARCLAGLVVGWLFHLLIR